MHKAIILFIPLFLSLPATAQKKKAENSKLYYFTPDWRSTTDADSAYYLGKLIHPDDTTWQWWYYQFSGPLITIETYKDEGETVPHGFCAWYDPHGRLDSMGYVYEGKKDRDWLYYTDSFTVYTTEKFDQGKLIEREDRNMLDKKNKERDTMKVQPGEMEARFRGGDKAWLNYLSTMNIPARAEKLDVKGTIRVLFVVLADGSISDLRLLSSLEYSIDEEAIRFIQASPRWNPAVQDGRNVRAYRMQPITVGY